MELEQAREYKRQLGLTSCEQWWGRSRDHRPAYMPSAPDATYAKEGWVLYANWMGYGKRHVRHWTHANPMTGMYFMSRRRTRSALTVRRPRHLDAYIRISIGGARCSPDMQLQLK